MAASTGNRPAPKKPTTSRTAVSNTRARKRQQEEHNHAIKIEIILIGILALAVLLFLCNFGIIGTVGNYISSFLFGLFGLTAYIVPILIFVAVAFGMSNRGNYIASMKLIAGVVLFLLIGIVCELFSTNLSAENHTYNIVELYGISSTQKLGGGIVGGSLAYLLYHFLDMVGTVLVVLVLGIACIVAITERSFLGSVKKGSQKVYESAREDAEHRRELAEHRRELAECKREEQEDSKNQIEEEEIQKKNCRPRREKKITGVMLDTAMIKQEKEKQHSQDMHEIILRNIAENQEVIASQETFDFDKIHITGIDTKPEPESKPESKPEVIPMTESVKPQKSLQPVVSAESIKIPKKYNFPPIALLAKGEHKNSNEGAKQLKETAMRLQQTLNNFGVRVTITDISQGPAVTRYELQPEQGVKVSKIVSLSDDIKLNLAATDIRIEAPIPGKAAIGIEVPNKENSAVALRELLESSEYKSFPSKLTFAVGKDIAGKTVVSDIAKMPHMLIAGATGSGKSVCINTLIMSILYKAHPDDVKMIMVDPKVVELSVYNGIPHLLIPVVTDPKKAAAALHWGVAEMTDRYKKFADYNVRDLKGFNKKIEGMKSNGEEEIPQKMPQIVIIVDELADLMMVAPGEVEESICRLAQLARAAGIHLIIATQRPSVDVITGLIKANMPSRVAFAVSSGVDSRTILDMNGAEKLLGKGDMLFYPQGYAKPARIQGAFVSDKEVSDVVEYLRNQAIGNIYSEDVEEKIATLGTSSGSAAGNNADERDAYFVEAGQFIIEKEKASIGMLQRVFKIGFNRAARIMDQLAEAGVVGEEEGTKPRKVLMSMEQFDAYIEEVV
ncbi:MAG: DNA translocase FtsK [Lachnospiraceae bacterium]